MFMQILLFSTMYPVLFILYFVYRTYRREKDGYLFGVRAKQEWCGEEEVLKIQAEYFRQLKRNFIVLLIIPLTSFFIPYVSIIFTVWLLWLLGAIVVMMIPFARAHKKMLSWKQERGWQQKDSMQYTELKCAGEVRCVNGLPYLLMNLAAAFMAVAAVLLIQKDFAVLSYMVVIFALINPLIYVLARWIDRQKVEVISTDSEVNLNFARAKKNIWNKCWLLFMVFNTLWTGVMFLIGLLRTTLFFSGMAIWGSVFYGLISILIFGAVWHKMDKIDKSYQEKRDLPELADDDNNWIFGMFYYNKNDRHKIVTARTGLGTTMNMATPLGMGVNIFGALVILIIPVCCIWMILLEFTPINLRVQNETIVATQLKTDYEIPLEEIVSMEEIGELPRWSRTNGTGMENVCKGTFFIRNEGKCQVFLDPRNSMFLKIETAERIYYLGGNSDDQTEEVKQAVLEALKFE